MARDGHMPPEAVESEASLLGAILLSKGVMPDVIGLVSPEDFFKPAHQFVFDAMRELWEHGDPIDAVTVADKLRAAHVLEEVGGEGYLIDLQGATPAISNAVRYAENVVRASRLRRIIELTSGLTMAAYEPKADPDEVFNQLCSLSGDRRLMPREVKLPDGYSTVGELILSAVPEEEAGGWIVPGMLRAMWRAMFIAGEGGAKSTVLKQIAACVAWGCHPFVGPGRRITPRSVLIIDAENPLDIIKHQFDLIDSKAGEPLSMVDNLHILHVEGGFDLRERTHQMQLEAVLQDCQPELLVIGPLYKLFSTRGTNDSSGEQAALEFLDYVESIRKRYRCAILVEHHAPKASGDSSRRLDPIGSSAWMRWPEFGIRLKGEQRDDHGHPHVLKVGRFRGDRGTGAWPVILYRDGTHQVPWMGEYADGSWKNGMPGVEVPNEPTDPGPFDDPGEPF